MTDTNYLYLTEIIRICYLIYFEQSKYMKAYFDKKHIFFRHIQLRNELKVNNEKLI